MQLVGVKSLQVRVSGLLCNAQGESPNLRSCRPSHLSNLMHVTISCCLMHALHNRVLVNLRTMLLK